MTPETSKLAQDFEKRLLEVLRGYLEQHTTEVEPYLKADISNLLVKFFIENKFMTPIPEVRVNFLDPQNPSKIRLDLINPKTKDLMTLQDFMTYCQWSPLKDRK